MTAARLRAARIDGACATFVWSDGFEASFAAAWLWDNASDGTTVGVQRLRSAQSLSAAGPLRSLVADGDAVRLEFAGDTLTWSSATLRAHAERKLEAADVRVLWDKGAAIATRPALSYEDYRRNDNTLAAALADVARFGFVRIKGAGTTLDELERTVARFGFIRETNYGRLFEVRVVADPDNLAFTARALEPHTDNPYRDPAPTLQLLHCIRDSGGGGATFFLDGFALAESFRIHHADDFERLAQQPVPFAFVNAAGDRYTARTPVLRLNTEGHLTGLRFNHRALQSVDLGAHETARWYEAYLKFCDAANEPARHVTLPMMPGDLVIFDNERILHGREAFSGASNRLLRGCYADRDGLLATLARLQSR